MDRLHGQHGQVQQELRDQDTALLCKNQVTLNNLVHTYYQQYKWMVIVYVVLAFILPVRDISMSHVSGKILQLIKDSKFDALKPYIIAVVMIIVFFGVIMYINTILEVNMFTMFEHLTRQKMTEALLDMQKQNFTELESGQVITRIGQLPNKIFNFFSLLKDMIVPKILVCVGIILYYAFVIPWVALCLLILFVGSLLMLYYGFYRCQPPALQRDAHYFTIVRLLDDVLKNIMPILNMNTARKELDVMDEMSHTYLQSVMDVHYCMIRMGSYTSAFLYAIIAIIFYGMYKSFKAKKTTLAHFITLIMLVSMMISQLASINEGTRLVIFRWANIINGLDMFKQCTPVQTMVKTKTEIEAETNANADANANGENASPPHPQGFSLRHIDYTYHQEGYAPRVIFQNFNMDIAKHEVTLIMGPIGSGKSTLLSLLMQYKLCQHGQIYLDGIPYASIPPEQLRHTIGFVHQHPQLFNRTVFENMTYGVAQQSNDIALRERVQELLRELRLEHLLLHLPHGLDTYCGKNGSHLSGGQRQIVVLIRVLLQNPDVLILDEPTSAVDDDTKDIIIELIERIMKGKTVIMVTHDKDLMKYATRVIHMEKGQVAYQKAN